MYCNHILLNRPLADSNLLVFNSLLQQARTSYDGSTCTGKLRTCVHLVLCVARLQYLSIDIDLILLHQYPQTQPVASKDKAKNLIRKPDTQKKPNLTPRETESPNWCPDLRHKASKRAQSHPTEAQIGPTRLPKAPKKPPKTPKKPPSGPTEVQMGPTWLQEGLPGNPKRPQKWAQTMHGRPLGKKLREIALFSWGNRVFQRKSLKNSSFLPSRGGSFLVFFVKITKNTSV